MARRGDVLFRLRQSAVAGCWLPVHQRHGHLGHYDPHRLGLRYCQFRLVDRYRSRRNADFGDFDVVAADLAQLHQSLRRSDDALCRGLRWIVPLDSYRASVGSVLDVSLSQHDGGMAPISYPVDLGRLRSLYVCNDFSTVLVCRLNSRPRDLARPRDEYLGQACLRRAGYGMAWFGAALEPLRNGLFTSCRLGNAAGALRAHRCELRFRGRHCARMAYDDLPALFRGGCNLLWICHGVDAGNSDSFHLRPERFHYRAAP